MSFLVSQLLPVLFRFDTPAGGSLGGRWPCALLVALAAGWATCAAQSPKPASPITDLAFSPNGDRVLACSQAGVMVYRWPQLTRESTWDVVADNLHAVRFSPDGQRVAVGGGDPTENGSVEWFSWPGGQSLGRIAAFGDSVTDLAWVDNGSWVGGSLDCTARRWKLDRPRTEIAFAGHSRGIQAVAVLVEQQRLITAGHDRSLRVWDLTSGQLIRQLNQHVDSITALSVRPGQDTSPMVASASTDRTVRFWQPTIGRMVRFARLDADPLDLAWLDRNRVAAACDDGKIRVIDATSVEILVTRDAIPGWAYAIAVHPAGRSLAVGGSDGQLVRLPLELD